MLITESQLRKVIREVIKENYNQDLMNEGKVGQAAIKAALTALLGLGLTAPIAKQMVKSAIEQVDDKGSSNKEAPLYTGDVDVDDDTFLAVAPTNSKIDSLWNHYHWANDRQYKGFGSPPQSTSKKRRFFAKWEQVKKSLIKKLNLKNNKELHKEYKSWLKQKQGESEMYQG